MQPEASDKQILLQRIRNGMIDVLELAADFGSQCTYQRGVPSVSVPNEVINQWDDWFGHHDPSRLQPPVFTLEEVDAVMAFDAVWTRVCVKTPNPLPELRVTQSLPAWWELREAAQRALGIFIRRGKLPEK